MILEPGTDEWLRARCGKVTASKVSDIATQTKRGEWGSKRRAYLIRLIGERLTGMSADANSFQTEAQLWGIETEPLALKAYGVFRNSVVSQVGYIDHPSIPMSGATPDGYVDTADDDCGLVQVKCPNTATHIAALIDRVIPEAYQFQMTWELACSPDAKWSDYVSYDPRITVPELRLAVIRLPRNPRQIAGLERAVKDFLVELDNTMATLAAGEMSYVPRTVDEPARLIRVEHMQSEDISASLTKPTNLFGGKR